MSQTDLFLLSQGGKSSSSSRKTDIKRLRKKLSSMEKSGGVLERAKDKVENITVKLANTLNEKVRIDTEEAAEKIVLYMEGKERNWEFDNCPSSSRMAHPASSPAGRTSSPVNTRRGSATSVRPATTSSGGTGSGSPRHISPNSGPVTIPKVPKKRTSDSRGRKKSQDSKRDEVITIIDDIPRQAPSPARVQKRPKAGSGQAPLPARVQQRPKAQSHQPQVSKVPPIPKPAPRPSVQSQKKPVPDSPRSSEGDKPVASTGVVTKTEPASQTDKPKKKKKKKPEEGTPNPFKWFFVPESSYNNRLPEFLLPPFIPSVFHLIFPTAQAEEMCAPWQNPPLSRQFFKSNGRIRAKAFCRIYSHNPRECRELLKDLRKALERVQKVDNSLQRLEARLSSLEQEQEDEEFERSISDEGETEARGFCLECFSDLRGALAPSSWQRFGSGLSLALGLGYSVAGVKEARRSRVNQLLALQGMPAENDGINSVLGAGLGVPLVAQGLDGLSQTIAPEYVCSPRFYNNPYVYNPYMY
ncbi:MAG: hypothetical protein OXB86_01530 [Bdellovibrionales bacterium]|nr:hypothetical protein [Bdellovibrionales bacterium]